MTAKKGKTTIRVISRFNHLQNMLVLQSIVVGVLSGIVAIVYRMLLGKMEHIPSFVVEFCKINMWFMPMFIVLLVVAGLFVGLLAKKEPMCKGSGIPQVEGEINGYFVHKPIKVIFSKFIGGAISLGAGLSLGREGPSVQLGAMAGKCSAKIFKSTKIEEKFLMTCGASAGLAAAFNAPLAGTMFALEEIHKNFSIKVLLSAMTASVIADFMAKNVFGINPIFTFENTNMIPLKHFWSIIILGIIIGIMGALYNFTLFKTQKLYGKISNKRSELRVVVAFLISGVLMFLMPQVLGGGSELVAMITKGNMSINLLVTLFLVKFLFSMSSFSSGAPGGIFLPLLVLGSFIGGIYGQLMINITGMNENIITHFVILGMAAYFTAIVRAPVTGIILITEMTGSFRNLLSLSLVCVIAYVIADILGSKPVYDVLLEKMIDKGTSKKDFSEEKTLTEWKVHHGCIFEDKKICNAKLPDGCLIVSIYRNEKEILPNGDTIIKAGDIITILTSEKNLSTIKKDMFDKCYV